MGLMTLADFEDDLNFSLGERMQQDNSRLDRWINQGYVELCSRVEFDVLKDRETKATVAEQDYVSLVATYTSIISLADLTNKRRLRYTALRNFHSLDPEVQGNPKLWSMLGLKLLLWPVPDGVFDISALFFKEPTILSAQDSVTVLPSVWDHGILLFAEKNAWLALRETANATLAYQAAQNYVAETQKEMDLNMGRPSVGLEVPHSWGEMDEMRSYDFLEGS